MGWNPRHVLEGLQEAWCGAPLYLLEDLQDRRHRGCQRLWSLPEGNATQGFPRENWTCVQCVQESHGGGGQQEGPWEDPAQEDLREFTPTRSGRRRPRHPARRELPARGSQSSPRPPTSCPLKITSLSSWLLFPSSSWLE